MQEVAASQTAMQEVAASQTAMDTVAASLTALDVVAASQDAANIVAASTTAVSAIVDASSSGIDSVPITNNASIYLAELAGGGGGGGSRFDNAGSGGEGGDTTFHESVAEGGGDGRAFDTDQPANSGRGLINTPDVEIDSSTGGGSSGGRSTNAQDGGDGGFVFALIVNPDRQSLNLNVGTGGFGRDNSDPGTDGFANIFTPNVF
jgi:hypothetical protein